VGYCRPSIALEEALGIEAAQHVWRNGNRYGWRLINRSHT